MRQLRNIALQQEFIGWQCRIRQMSVRNHEGMPMPAMRPRISSRKGDVLSPALTVLLVPEEMGPSLAFLRFQVQKTTEHKQARNAVVSYFAGEFYQLPELFRDEMTAVFAPSSPLAAQMVKLKEVLMDFEQYSQSYRMFAKVRQIGAKDEARDFSLWHARAFNPNIPNDSVVLGFKPDWRSAIGAVV
ncbi:hypothetical protein [Aestuariivirga sp.]|uniref:hypothetical protein n=1 Tax=Aestuariivirga sp. TaxID=2650926 RepID=UPI00391A18F8